MLSAEFADRHACCGGLTAAAATALYGDARPADILSGQTHIDCTFFFFFLVGRERHQVSTQDGEGFAAKLGAPFFETSAKTRHNVEKSFLTMVRHAVHGTGGAARCRPRN